MDTWVNFTHIIAWLFRANKMRSLFWRIVFGKWQINLANYTIHNGQISSEQNVGEIKQRIFRQILW